MKIISVLCVATSDQQNMQAGQKPKTMSKLNYLDWLRLQHYRPESLRTLKSLVGQLYSYLEQHCQSLNQSSLLEYIHWIADQGYSDAYQLQVHWNLRLYCRYQEQVHGLKLKLHLPKIQKANNRRKALKIEEIEQIKQWLATQEGQPYYALDQLLWCLFYGCGLRRSEALNLELKHLSLQEKLLEVSSLKGGKHRYIPLSGQQIKILVHYVEHRPKPQKGYENRLIIGLRGGKARTLLGRRLAVWQEGTGLGEQLCWHVLRHSIATQLAKKGMDIEQISRFLGHRDLSSTAHYLHYQT